MDEVAVLEGDSGVRTNKGVNEMLTMVVAVKGWLL